MIIKPEFSTQQTSLNPYQQTYYFNGQVRNKNTRNNDNLRTSIYNTLNSPKLFLIKYGDLSNRSYLTQELCEEIEKIRTFFLENYSSNVFKLYAIAAYPGCHLVKARNYRNFADIQKDQIGGVFQNMTEIDPYWWDLAKACGTNVTKTLERLVVNRRYSAPLKPVIEDVEVFTFKRDQAIPLIVITPPEKNEGKILEGLSSDGINFKILTKNLPDDLVKKLNDPPKTFNKYSHKALSAFFAFFHLPKEEFVAKYLNFGISLELSVLADKFGCTDLFHLSAEKLVKG